MKTNRKTALHNDPQVIETISPTKRGAALRLKVTCATCSTTIELGATNYLRIKSRDGVWSCYKCRKPAITAQARQNPLYQSVEYKEQFRQLHHDRQYYKRVHNAAVNSKIANSIRAIWRNNRERYTRYRESQKFKDRISAWAKKQWQDPNYRQAQHELRNNIRYKTAASNRSRALWQDPEYRKRIIDALDKARPSSAPKDNISSLQRILYSVLDQLNITYWPEGPQTIIGPIITTGGRFEGYSFDCLIQHEETKLLIECNGDYWHKTPERIGRDLAKATFLKTYYPEYELLVLWEYEFRSPTRIHNILLNKLGITQPEIIDFKLGDIIINTAPELNAIRCFLATNHYLANIGRDGSYRITAELNGTIIAAAVFSHPTRRESYQRLHLNKTQVYELTRFCILQGHHKKNFASWFLSRCLKIVHTTNKGIKAIISFADTTFDHIGTIYKATNWKLDGIVKPDYWYRDDLAWYHKKTIWDLAKKNGQLESQYALARGLHKVVGKQKMRYLYTF